VTPIVPGLSGRLRTQLVYLIDLMARDKNNYEEKDVAFYSATVNAWYTTKFEKDKHLLSLSSVGIGLLVTLVTAVGVASTCAAAMYVLAVLSFMVCILAVLYIFSRNADHLQRLINEKEDRDSMLAFMDKTATVSFLSGMVFTLLAGLFSGVESFAQQEVVMTKESDKDINTGKKIVKKSVNGASKMRPAKPADKPFGGDQSGQPGDKGTGKN